MLVVVVVVVGVVVVVVVFVTAIVGVAVVSRVVVTTIDGTATVTVVELAMFITVSISCMEQSGFLSLLQILSIRHRMSVPLTRQVRAVVLEHPESTSLQSIDWVSSFSLQVKTPLATVSFAVI